MSNSSYVPPVPPVPGQPPQKKKKSWLVYGLIGCAGIVVLGIVVAVALTFWVWDKVPKSETDVVAFIIEKANPDLEVLSIDKDAGTIAVKDKKTGKMLTMSLEDAKEGRLTIKGDDGESIVLNADGQGTARIQTEKGSAVIGAAAVENLPSWVALYPGTKPESGYSGTEEGKKTGMMHFTTSDSVAQVIDFYKEKLAAEGLQAEDQGSYGGTEQFANFTARSEDQRRSVTVSASREESQSETRVNVTYEEKDE